MSEAAQIGQIRAALGAIIAHLQRYGDTYTHGRLEELDARLAKGDPSAVSSVLSEASGSMGSLRDRYLSRENGDQVTALDAFDANLRLSALVEQLRATALANRSA